MKEVAEGFARNFLFPQHLAVEASNQVLREREEKKQRESVKEKREEKDQKKLAAKLDGFEAIVSAKADSGKLYAAITSKDVTDVLKKQKFKVKPEWIAFESKKEIGTFEAVVTFPSGFESTISIIIEAK